jgi:hypothetical protein
MSDLTELGPPGREAGDKTKLDRVFGDDKYDRDRRGRSFGRLGTSGEAGRGNQRLRDGGPGRP